LQRSCGRKSDLPPRADSSHGANGFDYPVARLEVTEKCS
jgi:hypothetical protein